MQTAIIRAKCTQCGHKCQQLVINPTEKYLIIHQFKCCKCGDKFETTTIATHNAHKIIDKR